MQEFGKEDFERMQSALRTVGWDSIKYEKSTAHSKELSIKEIIGKAIIEIQPRQVVITATEFRMKELNMK